MSLFAFVQNNHIKRIEPLMSETILSFFYKVLEKGEREGENDVWRSRMRDDGVKPSRQTRRSLAIIFLSRSFSPSHQNINHSVLSATTGSFLAALREGMIPEIRVSMTLMTTRMTAASMGRKARRLAMSVSAYRIMLIGMHRR